jgi:uncharacterized protein YraI
MKFELPPPLPEKRASRLRQAINARPEAPDKSSSQSDAGAPRAELANDAVSLSIPSLQASGDSSTVSRGSLQKPKLFSVEALVPVGILAFFLIVLGLIVLGSWNRRATTSAGDTKAPLPDAAGYSTPARTAAYMADSTPKAAPSISLTAPLPSLKGTVPPTLKALIPSPYTTPSATPKASVMRASLLYHVVNLANGDYLNVHSGAGSKYPVVGRLAADTGNISSTGKTRKNGNTTWVFISAESISGWVNADFLQPGEAKVTPPSATPQAVESPPISEAEERAKYWESRGYHFNPDFYTAYAMDQKVIDIDRAKYWESRGYHFNPDFYTAYAMDQKVIDIDRAKYWESRGYHFNPDFYTAYTMDLEVERMKQSQH